MKLSAFNWYVYLVSIPFIFVIGTPHCYWVTAIAAAAQWGAVAGRWWLK